MKVYERQRVARHEAGHSAALIMSGRLPWRITADKPAEGVWGLLDIAWDEEGELTPESVENLVRVIHAGPLYEEKHPSEWPPSYPPSLDAVGDEGQISACMHYLGWGRADWDAAYIEAVAFTSTPEFRRLARRIARALELKDESDRDDIRRLIGDETLSKHGIAPATSEEKENQ